MPKRVNPVNYKQVLTKNIAKYDANDVNSCRLWIGCKTSDQKYGKISIENKIYTAHIICYKIFVGPIEKGNSIRQSCGNGLCVNPYHLVQGPNTIKKRNTPTIDITSRDKKVANTTSLHKLRRICRSGKRCS
jgi:hypothetical protein